MINARDKEIITNMVNEAIQAKLPSIVASCIASAAVAKVTEPKKISVKEPEPEKEPVVESDPVGEESDEEKPVLAKKKASRKKKSE